MIYAETHAVRSRQIAADAALALWCLLWGLLGRAVYVLVDKLATPGEYLESASSDLGGKVASTGSKLPGALQAPFDGIGDAAGALQSAGETQASAAHALALALGWGVALTPIALVGCWYALRRYRWIREASAAQRLRAAPGFTTLMARRALATQPLHVLAAISDDPERDVTERRADALAALELGRLGLRVRAG